MIELKNSRTTYLGKASGRDRYSLDAFIGAVQMRDPGGQWQDIKPHLVRETDGWRIEGAPYYAEVKDDGTRLFCPDSNESGKYLRLPSPVYFSHLGKSIASSPTKIDGQLLANRVIIPTEWGEYRIIFSNTGMQFEVLFVKAPPSAVFGKDSPRILLDVESAGFDIGQLLKSVSGVGIPKPRLLAIENTDEQEKYLDWSYKSGQLELGFDFGELPFPILLKNTTVDVQVGAGGNDSRRFSGSLGFDNSGTNVIEGYYGSGSYGHMNSFHRFTGITLSGTIDVSYIEQYCYNAANPQSLEIYAIDEDNPAAPTNATEFDADPLTTNYVAWQDNITNNDWNQSPSLNSVIQELVDSYTISNDAVMIQVRNDGQDASARYKYAYTYEYDDNSYGAKLHVEYTAGGATEKSGNDSGSGADVKSGFLAQAVKDDSGSGADTRLSLLADLTDADSGAGSEQGLLSLLLSSADAGAGAEAAAMLLAGIIKGDNGSGMENIMDRALNLPDSGSGADVLINLIAAIVKSETGAGIDQGTLSSIVARLSAETGSGSDIAELIAGLVSSETGLGIDAGVIVGLKQLFSGDEGACGDVLKALINISGRGSDMKLTGRQGRVGMPSRGVSL